MTKDLNPVNYSIWGALQHLVYRRRRIRDAERLKKSCKPAGSRLFKTLSIALYDNFANDCRSLLQLVEDTLSTALTNVLGATHTLSYVFCCRNTELGQQK